MKITMSLSELSPDTGRYARKTPSQRIYTAITARLSDTRIPTFSALKTLEFAYYHSSIQKQEAPPERIRRGLICL